MMDNFSQILCRLLTTSDTSTSSGHSGSAPPFKVQVNFDIPIFEGQIDADALQKWVKMPEFYFSVYNFSNGENITFSLKVVPHVKYWWEPYYEKASIEESEMFGTKPTQEYFVDALKGQYYPVGNYEDQYTRWTTLQQERDQAVSEFTYVFHTIRTKLGIKDSEQHLALKYRGCLHKYIQTEMEFLDISSLGATYRYVFRIEQKIKQRNRRYFGSMNTSQQKVGK